MKSLAILFALVLAPQFLGANITYVSANGGTGRNLTFTASSGPNRVLLCEIIFAGASGPTSVDWNGMSLTQETLAVDTIFNTSMWWLVAPTAGATANLTVTGGSLGIFTVNILEYDGVNQVEPFNFNSTTNGTTNPPSVTVTVGAASNWILTFFASNGSGALSFSSPVVKRLQNGITPYTGVGDWNLPGTGNKLVGATASSVSFWTLDGFELVSDGITFTPTFTVSPTPTVTKTVTPTKTITPTRSPTPTKTPRFPAFPTKTPSPTKTVTPTITPTFTVSPTITVSPTRTRSVSPTPTRTPRFAPVPTKTRTPTGRNTPTNTPTATVTT